MTIGDNIKKQRIEKGLTQKELGEKLDISQQMIGQYESGARNPKLETIRKIAKALEVTINVLLDGHWNEFSQEEIAKDFINKTDNIIPALSQKEMLKEDLLRNYEKLNEHGQIESVKRISELAKIKEYTE